MQHARKNKENSPEFTLDLLSCGVLKCAVVGPRSSAARLSSSSVDSSTLITEMDSSLSLLGTSLASRIDHAKLANIF